MATLRELRGRISGVKKTQKITKAMKMVAAAKLRRAQANMIQARPYAAKIKALLQHLSLGTDMTQNSLFQVRPVNAVAVVVVTADRGFCGAFNNNLVKAAEKHILTSHKPLLDQGKVKIFAVGKKGFDYFNKRGYSLAGKYIGVYNNLIFSEAQTIVRDVLSGYEKGEYDQVEIISNEFKSVAQSKISLEQFLPIAPLAFDSTQHKSVDYIYEPSPADILKALVPKHLNFVVWKVLLESNASEQGARMAAMENATTNANELINTLQLSYNKARQASITSELLEIVGGAEALQKG
ncbi:MAG: ATP synthase F1 subunit gamma [Ignavibacteriae bacterium]|nr:ATP synthase F1 subunit gamma [Ignavibacteriota bacterium]